MRTVTRIVTSLVCVVIHVSGSPNPEVVTTEQTRCLSIAEAEARGLSVTALREEYTAAVEAFPNKKAELAEAWSKLQYTLRDRLRESGDNDLGGRSIFTVFFFEPDGRISRVLYRGLDPDEATVFCEVIENLSEDYRFPLASSTRFSQCGTTHFKGDEEIELRNEEFPPLPPGISSSRVGGRHS